MGENLIWSLDRASNWESLRRAEAEAEAEAKAKGLKLFEVFIDWPIYENNLSSEKAMIHDPTAVNFLKM